MLSRGRLCSSTRYQEVRPLWADGCWGLKLYLDKGRASGVFCLRAWWQTMFVGWDARWFDQGLMEMSCSGSGRGTWMRRSRFHFRKTRSLEWVKVRCNSNGSARLPSGWPRGRAIEVIHQVVDFETGRRHDNARRAGDGSATRAAPQLQLRLSQRGCGALGIFRPWGKSTSKSWRRPPDRDHPKFPRLSSSRPPAMLTRPRASRSVAFKRETWVLPPTTAPTSPNIARTLWPPNRLRHPCQNADTMPLRPCSLALI